MSLEPIEPEHALELYIADRENNVSQATIYSHRSRLGHFISWCNGKADIRNLNGVITPMRISTSASLLLRRNALYHEKDTI